MEEHLQAETESVEKKLTRMLVSTMRRVQDISHSIGMNVPDFVDRETRLWWQQYRQNEDRAVKKEAELEEQRRLVKQVLKKLDPFEKEAVYTALVDGVKDQGMRRKM